MLLVLGVLEVLTSVFRPCCCHCVWPLRIRFLSWFFRVVLLFLLSPCGAALLPPRLGRCGLLLLLIDRTDSRLLHVCDCFKHNNVVVCVHLYSNDIIEAPPSCTVHKERERAKRRENVVPLGWCCLLLSHVGVVLLLPSRFFWVVVLGSPSLLVVGVALLFLPWGGAAFPFTLRCLTIDGTAPHLLLARKN